MTKIKNLLTRFRTGGTSGRVSTEIGSAASGVSDDSVSGVSASASSGAMAVAAWRAASWSISEKFGKNWNTETLLKLKIKQVDDSV